MSRTAASLRSVENLIAHRSLRGRYYDEGRPQDCATPLLAITLILYDFAEGIRPTLVFDALMIEIHRGPASVEAGAEGLPDF